MIKQSVAFCKQVSNQNGWVFLDYASSQFSILACKTKEARMQGWYLNSTTQGILSPYVSSHTQVSVLDYGFVRSSPKMDITK
jgi:hypothetical protein